jgi:mannitol-1-/sugar-/sorbitol-6-phosphatase
MSELACDGVLFDCDGVLVDSDASVMYSWQQWADAVGLDRDAITSIVHGRRSEDTIAELLPADRLTDAVALIERIEVADAARVTAIAGACELLAVLPAGRWAVVTSGTRALATARLHAAGLPIPDVLVTADDVANGKPDPEGYRTAARRLALEPARTVVLEDAPSGVLAARATGVAAVIGVGSRDGLPEVELRVRDLTALYWTGHGLATIC